MDTNYLVDSHIIHQAYISGGGLELFMGNEIILKFKPNITEAEKSAIITSYSLSLLDSSTSYMLYRSADPLAASLTINNTGKVVYCTPNFHSKSELLTIPNDPYFSKQYYLRNTGQQINYGQTGTVGADIKIVDAWDITTGSASTIVAVIDEGLESHADLSTADQLIINGCNVSSIDNGSDPNNPAPPSFAIGNHHGEGCAGIIAANHNNIGIAGIAPECIIMPIRIENAVMSLQQASAAIDFAVNNGANIISNSWGWYDPNPNAFPSVIATIENAINNGLTIVWAAGNSAQHYSPNWTNDGYVIFPASAKIDGLVVVGATDRNDEQACYSPHSSLDRNLVDLTAPSHRSYYEQNQSDTWDVWSLDIQGNDGNNPFPWNDYPQYGISYGEELPNTGADRLSYTAHFGGTSAAAPQVAGVAALMLAVNPCLSNNQLKDIIENSADKVGVYDYTWQPHGMSKETGHGRLNATRAVQNALEAHTNTLDLYIKDCDQDFGHANSPNYNCWSVTDKSPDIWVRNTQAQPDFSGNFDYIHEDPEYSANNPVYIYVRIRNKSCVTSLGTEQLGLYWSKAATWQSWPQNWNGTDPNIGNLVSATAIYIPVLQPGESTIIEVPWSMPLPLAPGPGGQLPVCILARIEGSATDPVVLSPSGNNDVEWSNNVAIANMTAVDNVNNVAFYKNGILHPIGKEILIGNSDTATARSFDFSFETEKGQLAVDARVHLITNEDGYDILSASSTFSQDGVQGIDSTNEILLTKDSIYIKNVSFDPGVRIPLWVGFSFYTSSTDSNATYSYKISQSVPDSVKKLGAETFMLSKYNRAYFNADAGADKSIKSGMTTQLNAVPVGESALYKWYDASNHFIGQGQHIAVAPTGNTFYKLEVISNLDGFMDADTVGVIIIEGTINSVSPNPCTDNIALEYSLSASVQVANVVLTNVIANTSTTFSLDINSTSQTLDVSNLPVGMYTLTLICNGLVTDAINIIKL